MKSLPIYLTLFGFALFAESTSLHAQEEKERILIFDAAGIGVNHTMLGNDGGLTYDWGFSAGLYHSGRKGKRLDILFGLEYNLNRQVLDYRFGGREPSYRDLQYTIHTVSLPLFARWHIDRKQRFFIEGGGFLDLHVHTVMQGVRITVIAGNRDESNHRSRADINQINYGPYAGVGCRVHIAGQPFLLKADARYGLPSIYAERGTDMHLSYGRVAVVMEF